MLVHIDKAISIVKKVAKWLTIVSAICITVMLLINIIEVVGAKWFKWSFIGYLELTEQLMVPVSILSIAYIAPERGHIRITMVSDRLPSPVRFALDILGYVLGILVMVLCTWRAYVQMNYAMNAKLTTNTLFIPVWPTNLVIMIGFCLLFFSWLLILIKRIAIAAQTK